MNNRSRTSSCCRSIAMLVRQVHTDAGLVGLGESGAWGYPGGLGLAVETFKRYLIGQDPLRIEHHWQYLYRWTHFRGAAIMGALSAIDIALWDIAGKHFGVPCYQLMGARCATRRGSTITSLARPKKS
jgi:galactonate dehydratase